MLALFFVLSTPSSLYFLQHERAQIKNDDLEFYLGLVLNVQNSHSKGDDVSAGLLQINSFGNKKMNEVNLV